MPAQRSTLALILLAAWFMRSASVRAEPGLLVVGGNAGERERTTVGSAVEKAIRAAGWTLPAKAPSKKDSDSLLKCPDSSSPWTCIPNSAKGIHGAFVVSIDTMDAEDGASTVVITGKMIVTTPPAFTVQERHCEHCADDKLAEAGAELVRELTRELAKRSGRTVVVIKSIPSSATLILDGEALGGTDATLNTFPGKHTAMVQKPGYISELREFVVEEGKTAEVTFNLRASEVTSRTDHPPPQVSQTPRVPLVLIGAGAAFTLFGTISLYEGQRNVDKFNYKRATVMGIATGLVGLGAVGTGVYLLYRNRSGAAPTVSVGPHSVTLGWSGRL